MFLIRSTYKGSPLVEICLQKVGRQNTSRNLSWSPYRTVVTLWLKSLRLHNLLPIGILDKFISTYSFYAQLLFHYLAIRHTPFGISYTFRGPEERLQNWLGHSLIFLENSNAISLLWNIVNAFRTWGFSMITLHCRVIIEYTLPNNCNCTSIF